MILLVIFDYRYFVSHDIIGTEIAGDSIRSRFSNAVKHSINPRAHFMITPKYFSKLFRITPSLVLWDQSRRTSLQVLGFVSKRLPWCSLFESDVSLIYWAILRLRLFLDYYLSYIYVYGVFGDLGNFNFFFVCRYSYGLKLQ